MTPKVGEIVPNYNIKFTPKKIEGETQGTTCPADFTNDGQVDSGDLALLLGAWGTNQGSPYDLNNDEQVDSGDLALLLGAWGPCGLEKQSEIPPEADMIIKQKLGIDFDYKKLL